MKRCFLTEDEKKEIIERYKNGENAKEISRDFDCHNSTISRLVKKEGISRGRRWRKDIVDNLDNVVSLYLSGKTCDEVAECIGVDVHTVYSILDEKGIKRRPGGVPTNCKKDYFETINNPNKAYLLGFITADGSVSRDFSCVGIEVKRSDSGLITFAQQQINPKAKIYDIKYQTSTYCKSNGKTYVSNKDDVKITFNSRDLARSLGKYGIVPNKTFLISKVPVDLIPNDLLRYYFRGLIDGDGCIHKDGKISIYSGSFNFIKDVQKVLSKQVGISLLKIYHGTSYFVTWSSKEDKRKMFHYLYDDLNATYFYPRKYQRLLDFMKKYGYVNTEITS